MVVMIEGVSLHSLASMNLGFRKGAIRAKSWFSQNVDAFLHSSIINLKKKFQCLHFQLFQAWTTWKLYLSMILSDFVEKRKRGGKKTHSWEEPTTTMMMYNVDFEDDTFHDDARIIPQSEGGRLRQVMTVVCCKRPLTLCANPISGVQTPFSCVQTPFYLVCKPFFLAILVCAARTFSWRASPF